MTGKRYSYDPKQVAILKDGKFWLEGQIDTACNHSEICNELNQLSEENEQLKIQIDDVNNESIGYEEQIEKLLKKNEQLKAQLQRYEIDFKQFEKECQECEKGILRIIDDKIQSARELGTVKTVIVLKNLRKEIIKCKD